MCLLRCARQVSTARGRPQAREPAGVQWLVGTLPGLAGSCGTPGGRCPERLHSLTRAPLAEFAAALGAALHPGHGCFLLNLHSLEGPHPVATFKNGLLGGAWSADSSDSNGPSASSGTCFAVAAQRQRNVCVVVARGLALPADQAAAGRLLLSEAQRVAEAAGYRFPAGSRACRQLQLP